MKNGSTRTPAMRLGALLLLAALAGCSTCQIAVGGALWAHDPAKDTTPGADLRLLSASDEDRSGLLVNAARRRGVEEGLWPVTTATVTAWIVGADGAKGHLQRVDVEGANTFSLVFTEVELRSFEAVEVTVDAPGFQRVSWNFPKIGRWSQSHYDVSMDAVLETEWRRGR